MRAMVRFSMALLAGAVAAQLTSFAPAAYPFDRLFLSCLAVRIVAGRPICTAYSLGIGLYLAHAWSVVDSRLIPAYAGDSIVTEIEVLGFPAVRDNTVRLLARPLDRPALPERLWLLWDAPPAELRGGDRWELVVRLRRPRTAGNPGGFDAEAWYFSRRVGAAGRVVASPRNRLTGAGFGSPLLRLRQRLADRVVAITGTRESAAVLLAITVGTRHALSAEQWDRFARTGTSHLMAISGLHIGLAALAAYAAVRAVLFATGFRGRARHVALVTALVVAGLYVLVSGAAVPALRAGLMLGLATLAWLRLRPQRLAGTWSLAAAAIGGVDPLAVGSAGFILSFGAVLLLLWHSRLTSSNERGPLRRFGGAARVQIALLLALLPATALLFGRFAPAAPLINLLVVPVFSMLTVPIALAGLILAGPLEPAGDALLRVAAGSVDAVDLLLTLDSWPAGRLSGRFGVAGLVCLALATAFAWLPRGWPGRWVSLPALAAVVVWDVPPPASNCARVTLLAVGQGQAALVETRGYRLLYDTGPAYPGGSSMDSQILPFLAYRGVAALDTTVVSHADSDHAGGLRDLLDAMPAGRLLVGEPLEVAHRTLESCHTARPWRRDGVRFSFERSPEAASADGNDASCVLRIEVGEHRVLLTGDIERAVELALVRSGRLRTADIVTMPHHGSRTSSSSAFVRAVAARWALASTGHANRWGFPKPDVVARWQRHGTEVMTTGERGAIEFELCDARAFPEPVAHRDRSRRAWHDP